LITDVNPNRCGEPVNPLKGTLALQGGEEVSVESLFYSSVFSRKSRC
jgi:hypothetical protein